MAGVREDKLKKAGPWPQGVNNLAPEGALPTDEFGTKFVALREADNVDISKEGRVTRRRGYTTKQAMSLAHSLWSHAELGFGLLVDDGVLHSLMPGGAVASLGVVTGNEPVSYELVNDRVFWTNRSRCGLLTLDLDPWDWAPECPNGQPALALAGGYALTAGQYQVAVTFSDALGRESGSMRAAVIAVADGSGIALTSIPQPVSATTINVYLSDPNGTTLHRHSRLPAGTASYLLSTFAQGPLLDTMLLRPMPAGQIVRLHNGRQWVADGRNLRWSSALRYGLTNPGKDVIRFDADIDMLEPVGSGEASAGLYVAAGGRTYWFGGKDPMAFNRKLVSSSGAIPRSQVYVPGNYAGADTIDDVTMWVMRNGQYCVGLEGGKLTPLKQGQAVVDDATSAASLFVERNGLAQVVTTMKGPRPQGMAISDRAVAHVVHNPL